MLQDDQEYITRLGKRITARREELGYSLLTLAEKTDITKGQLSKIEHGKNSTTITILRKIANELNTTIGRLCDL